LTFTQGSRRSGFFDTLSATWHTVAIQSPVDELLLRFNIIGRRDRQVAAGSARFGPARKIIS